MTTPSGREVTPNELIEEGLENLEPGEYKVRLIARPDDPNHSGEIEIPFDVKKYTLSENDVVNSYNGVYSFTGETPTFDDIKLVVKGVELVRDVDYKVATKESPNIGRIIVYESTAF